MRRITNREAEELLAGTSDNPEFSSLEHALEAIPLEGSIPDDVAAAHISAAAAIARQAQGSARVQPGNTRRRRRLAIGGALSGVTAKIILGTALAVAATGGAAVTGKLPTPIQQVLSDTAAKVGVSLPNPNASTTSTTTALPTSTTTTASVTTSEASTTTTIATTTTSGSDDGDEDDGDNSGHGDGTETPPAVAGPHKWTGTSCAGAAISVAYTVTESGTLTLGTIVGQTNKVTSTSTRIEVRYQDDIRVRIELKSEDDGLHVTTEVERDCESGGGGSTTTTTAEDEEDDD